MAEILDPKLDVVFKLLFAALENRRILVALLNAVLQPPQAIRQVDVINPEVNKTTVNDRGVVFDIHVAHDDGSRTNIEMQNKAREAIGDRALYHWARTFSDSLRRGDKFADLRPCRVVMVTSFAFLPGQRLHSTFRTLEIHDGTLVSHALELHAIELPKRKPDGVRSIRTAVEDWATFLATDDHEVRRRLAMHNPDVKEANEALERLSQDPEAQRLAQQRTDELRLAMHERTIFARKQREKGLEDGRKQGLEDGRKQGLEDGRKQGFEDGRKLSLKAALRDICQLLGIALTAARVAQLEAATDDELDQLRQDIVKLRGWPDGADGEEGRRE